MKKVVAMILAIGMVFSLTACGGEKKMDQTAYEKMTADDLLKNIKDQTNVTLEEYIDLVSTLSNVTITEDLELEDNITTEAIQKLRDNDAQLPSPEEYVEPLLKSEAPQVRGYAISNVGSLFGVSDEHIAAAKEMLKTEQDPYVLRCAVKALANEGGSDPDIGQFLLDMAKNENVCVRQQVASALGSSWNKDLEGAVEAEIALMNDSDTFVRKAAYRYAGGLEDERIIEPIVEMLNNEADADLHGDGVESLVSLWYDYPFHENTSEAAYRATMDYLKTAPRTENTPAWTAVSSFSYKSNSSFDAWREKATYFNPDEIAEIMTELVQDTNVNWMARTAAVKTMAAHCSREDFDALGSVVEGLTDDKAKYIQDEYQTRKDELDQ